MATTVILARVLDKEDFGVAGYAIVTINLLDMLQDLGLGPSIIFHKEDSERSNTAFWLGISLSLCLFGTVWLAAPLAGMFFKDDRAISVIRILALTFPLTALSNIHDSLIRKELKFGRKMIPDLIRVSSKGAIAIVLAFLGFGAWSLIYGQILGTALCTIAFWWICPFRPSFHFDSKHVRPLLTYGLGSVFVDLLGAITINADYLLVGRFLGAAALGVYTISFRIPELLIKQFCGVIGRVMFPVYTRIRADGAGLGHSFLRTIQFVTMVTFPVALGLILIAEPLVLTLFSSKWKEAIPVVRAISFYTLIRSLVFNVGDIYKAEGKVSLLAKLSFIQVLILIPSLYWAVTTFRTITAVAWIQVAVVLVGGGLKLIVATRILALRPAKLLAAVQPPATAAALMAPVVLGMLYSLAHAPHVIQLIACTIAGGITYLLALWWLNRETMRTAGKILRTAFTHR